MKRIITLLVLLATFVFVSTGWSVTLSKLHRESENSVASSDLIRLHILANSDSPEDQALKLKVRDAVVNYLSPKLAKADTVDAAREIVSVSQDEIAQVARETLVASGSKESVQVEMGRFEFPLRTYGSLVLPSGEYEAVRVLIGAAQGRNWWCVLFPPLCLVDATNAAAVPVSSAPGSGNEAGRTIKPEVRWKLAELWNNTKSE